MSPPKIQFCPRGHDTFVTGRVKSNGQCILCAKTQSRKYSMVHKVETLIRWKKWQIDNPEQYRKVYYENNWRQKGILNEEKKPFTIEDFDRLAVLQSNLCKICLKPENDFKQLSVDHNHETGIVRGLLCHKCNIGLGHFQDNVNYIQNAIMYLRGCEHGSIR